MSEARMSEIIKTSLEGVKDFTGVDTIFGNAITTPGGVTVIPVSKVSVGFAGGGVDIPSKKLVSPQNFGGGSGTGVSITPVAFLTVGSDASINLIEIGSKRANSIEHTLELIESSPAIIKKIKDALS